MAKLPGLKLSENEVSQTIDLKEVFGLPLTGNESLKQEIGQAIIDKIISRTENGVDVNGKPFAKYSKEYITSDEFKAFGKSEGEIDMTLTGNMLGSLDIVESKASKIKIGWSDSTENAKAYNHNTGDTVKKRAFFGANASLLNEVKQEFKSRVKEEIGQLQSEKNKIRADIIKRLGANPVDIDNDDE